MSNRYPEDFDLDIHVSVLKAYLEDSFSHREIQKKILGLPAPPRGGGFVTMGILHFYEIREDKKGILKRKPLKIEYEESSGKYKKALHLLIKFTEYENYIKKHIKDNNDFSIPENVKTEFSAIVKQRISQNILRGIVLDNYKHKCALCNVDQKDLLVCSHIKPWAVDEENRLNEKNAISLCVWHDKLFDKGYITFSNKLEIMIAKTAPDYIKKEISDLIFNQPKKGHPDSAFLKYHRESIFRKD